MSAANRLTDFVVERAEGEPYARQAQLYRDLAELSVDEQRAAQLRAMAARAQEMARERKQLRLALGESGTANGNASA